MAAEAPMPAAIVHKLIVSNYDAHSLLFCVLLVAVSRAPMMATDAWRSATSSKQQAETCSLVACGNILHIKTKQKRAQFFCFWSNQVVYYNGNSLSCAQGAAFSFVQLHC